jgi:hypothetical protein
LPCFVREMPARHRLTLDRLRAVAGFVLAAERSGRSR